MNSSNSLGMTASGTYYDSAGESRIFFPEFDHPSTNSGIAENVDGDNSNQFFTNIDFRGFQLEGAYGSREKHIPTASFGTAFNNPDTRTIDSHAYLDLAYNHKFGSNWGFAARAYYDRAHYDGLYPHSSDPEDSALTVNRDAADGQWFGAKFALSKQLFDRQTLILGSEYEDHFQMKQINHDERPRVLHFDSEPTANFVGVYLQDEIRLRSDLTLGVGLRHDQYSSFGGTTNPRAALIYQPLEMTTIKLLYGQSFRPPTAYELCYAIEELEANPNLRPERVKTMELALEQYLPRGVQISASAYYYPIRSLISQVTDPANGNLVFENGQRVDMRGAEASFKKHCRSGIEAGVSFSFQKAKKLDGQAALTNSPSVLNQTNLTLPVFRSKFFASADISYVSRRMTNAGIYAGAYMLPDFTLLSRSFERWTLSASLYNAFNKKYFDPPSLGDSQTLIAQYGRSFRLKVTFHL